MSDLRLTSLLLFPSLFEFKTLFGDADKLLVVEFLQLGDRIFVNRVDEKENFETLLLKNLEERRVLDGGERFTGQVVNRLLDLGHAGNVVFEGNLLVGGLGGVEPQVFGKLGSVLGVLVDTKFDVLAESLVELGEVVLVLSDFGEEIQTFLDNVLADDLQNLVLLKSLAGDVEREILGVDNTLHKVEVLRDEVLTIVHNEDTADVELDVVALLLGFEEIERRSETSNISQFE